MLLEHLIDIGEQAAYAQLAAGEINAFYQAAKVKFDADPAFADRSRRRVVALQAGDPETLRLWRTLIDDSKQYYNAIYAGLGVTLTDADLAPESFYNPLLEDVCRDLEQAGHRGHQRRRAVRVPARLHRPGRQPAAADPAQERRRLRLRDHRHGRDQVPGQGPACRPDHLRGRLGAGAALRDGVRRRAAGRLAARLGHRRARRDRHGDRHRPEAVQVTQRRVGQADRPDRRGRLPGRGSDQGPVRRP